MTSGEPPGQFRDSSGTIPGQFRDSSGTIPGQFRDNSGTLLAQNFTNLQPCIRSGLQTTRMFFFGIFDNQNSSFCLISCKMDVLLAISDLLLAIWQHLCMLWLFSVCFTWFQTYPIGFVSFSMIFRWISMELIAFIRNQRYFNDF